MTIAPFQEISDILGREPRILLVEDEPDIRELLGTYVMSMGFRDVTQMDCTGEAAQRILNGEHYDIIVSDIHNQHGRVPDKRGGLTLYQQLEQANKLPSVYILMSGEEKYRVDPVAQRAHAFVEKPFRLREFGASLIQGMYAAFIINKEN